MIDSTTMVVQYVPGDYQTAGIRINGFELRYQRSHASCWRIARRPSKKSIITVGRRSTALEVSGLKD